MGKMVGRVSSTNAETRVSFSAKHLKQQFADATGISSGEAIVFWSCLSAQKRESSAGTKHCRDTANRIGSKSRLNLTPTIQTHHRTSHPPRIAILPRLLPSISSASVRLSPAALPTTAPATLHSHCTAVARQPPSSPPRITAARHPPRPLRTPESLSTHPGPRSINPRHIHTSAPQQLKHPAPRLARSPRILVSRMLPRRSSASLSPSLPNGLRASSSHPGGHCRPVCVSHAAWL